MNVATILTNESRLARASGPLTTLFAFFVIATAMRGIQLRSEFYLAPDRGLGYALGILGGSMMLLLLLYPIRKKFGFMRGLGAVRHWFRMHMVLGVLGPLCIVFHCNFSLGATNSNVALLCMVLMVTSGLVGRFIYARIHLGLYGERANREDLKRSQLVSAALIRGDEARYARVLESGLMRELQELQELALVRGGTLNALKRLLVFGIRSRILAWKFRRRIRDDMGLDEAGFALLRRIDSQLETLRRISGFAFFERLFSLWHALHMPIFLMLVATGAVHVWAVHHY